MMWKEFQKVQMSNFQKELELKIEKVQMSNFQKEQEVSRM